MRAAGGLCGALLTKVWCFFNTPMQEKQPPSKRARPRPNYTEKELDDLRAAKELKVKWQLRGPPADVLPPGTTWHDLSRGGGPPPFRLPLGVASAFSFATWCGQRCRCSSMLLGEQQKPAAAATEDSSSSNRRQQQQQQKTAAVATDAARVWAMCTALVGAATEDSNRREQQFPEQIYHSDSFQSDCNR